MKTWRKKYEWTAYAACAESDLHTGEYGDRPEPDDIPGSVLTEFDLAEARNVCAVCSVRPECIEWALQEKACSVVVAGIYLPDPFYKKDLRAAYSELQKSLPSEKKMRGDV